ncbi:MAG: glycosyltransferase [Prevotella sp.]|nr:glycosyltransferase [Prevotella sp.]
MKRALIVIGSLKMGGRERVAVNCVKYYANQDIQFDFLVFGSNKGELEGEVEEMGCSIHRISHSKNPLAFYKTLGSFLLCNGPYDIIHSHIFFNSGIVVLAAKKCGIRCRISHSHSIERRTDSQLKKYTYQAFMRFLINRYSTKICACSYAAGEYVFGTKKFKNRGIIIPNIIDVQQYTYSIEERNRIREEFRISDSDIVLGTIGHLTPIKNTKFLLEIAALSNKDNNIKFLVVGDGPLYGDLKELADSMHVADKVIFTGIRKDIRAILSAMDLYICTSLSEGFGVVLLESLANGLPYVAEKNALVKEVLDLGHVELVDGFSETKDWIEAARKLLKEGRAYNAFPSLVNSIYTPNSFKDVIKELYIYV